MLSQRSTMRQNEQRPVVSATERLSIGQLARLTGIGAKAIRYYESIGLLPCPRRQGNGYRCYSQIDVNRLTLLRRLRLLGIPLAVLGPLLTGASDTRCIEVQQEVLSLIQAKLSALDQEMVELHQLRAHIEDYQNQLTSCQPDEQESFCACRDMSCLALSARDLVQGGIS
jgi:MerR family transcriptional regulator, copper efflux regulator